MAAVCAVVFPFLLFFRVNAPLPYLVPSILVPVTVALIVGYSWQDGLHLSASNSGQGWEVGWKRFLTVVIGCTAAFIASFLPPESARKQTRLTLAKTLDSLADVFLELLSYSTVTHTKADMLVVRTLIAVNNKLRISVTQRINGAVFELKSGDWPEGKYVKLQQLQLELSDLLAQLLVVYYRIEEPYRESLLYHTRFLDPRFVSAELMCLFSSI